MKTQFVNQTETYYPCVVEVLTGKYGIFAKLNGINFSEKKMKEKGYQLLSLGIESIEKIRKENELLKIEKDRIYKENFLKKLTEISFTFLNGEKISSVNHFKRNSENIGQKTQGSDAHESIVSIDGEKKLARKHWSNDGIGIWDSTEITNPLGVFVGSIYFLDNKVFLKKNSDLT